MSIFHKYKYLSFIWTEIALAILAANELKIEANNLAV